MRSHIGRDCVKELRHWTLRNAKGLEVSYISRGGDRAPWGKEGVMQRLYKGALACSSQLGTDMYIVLIYSFT